MTKYHCNMCKMLLQTTYEVYHKIDFYEEVNEKYDNLQEIYPNCHS